MSRKLAKRGQHLRVKVFANCSLQPRPIVVLHNLCARSLQQASVGHPGWQADWQFRQPRQRSMCMTNESPNPSRPSSTCTIW